MKLRTLLGSIALATAASSSMAAVPAGCSAANTTAWNSLGPPALQAFGNSFTAAGSYVDCYTFRLDSSANSFGGTLELDGPLNKLNIDLTSVSLFRNGEAFGAADDSPLAFSFGGLAGGAQNLYTLTIASTVASVDKLYNIFSTPVGYTGAILTIAAPVPEPGAVALMIAGLLGVGTVAWRRRGA